MRPAHALKALAPLLKKPFFTAKEARRMGVHPSVLNHYIKMGQLIRIRRGVYQYVEYENPAAFMWEDLVEAVYCVKGGVVCLISALAVYDLTEEIPRQHWIAIPHGTSIKISKEVKLVRFRNMELGKTEIELEGEIIPIFDRERTIIDAFRYLSIETALKALRSAVEQGGEAIDLLKLQEYARVLRVNIRPYLLSLTLLGSYP